MKSVTSVFRSLPVVHAVCRAGAVPAVAASFGRDALTMGWEERMKIRARRISDGGVEFATALPRGTVLRDGDCLVIDVPGIVIHIVEEREPVLVIRPQDSSEAALFAYHVGNSHQPMMLCEGLIVCPDLLGMAPLLEYHRIPFERANRPFTPVGQVTNHQHALGR